ncbi:MAG: hypothetical protein RSA48_02720 [Bacilli bacterium]
MKHLNIIARRGFPSKNAPADTKDAIILALNNKNIKGISLELGLTKDLEVIITPCRSIGCTAYFQRDIKDYTLEELKPYNIGSNIHFQGVSGLLDILAIYPDDKILLLNVPTTGKRNISFVLKLKEILAKYPTKQVYLTSSLKELILLFKQELPGIKIGQNILTLEQLESEAELDLDFYVLTECCIKEDFITEKLIANKDIFVFPVNSILAVTELSRTLDKTFDRIYLMTNNVSLISNYLSTKKRATP